MLILILKGLLLFLGIWFSIINIGREINQNNISGYNLFCQAIGITGFIFLQWILI